MRTIGTIRKWQMEQLNKQPAVIKYIITREDKSTLISKREKENGWTVAQVIGHLLDCERLFLQRAEMTIKQNLPMLHFPNQDEEVIKGHYNDTDPRETLKKWINQEALSKIPERRMETDESHDRRSHENDDLPGSRGR